jgi:hypothetical protein
MNHKKTITLKFQNWDKHQVRKDYKRPHWFALSNDFHLDAKLGEFSDQEKLVLIYLLCEASRQNKRGKLEIFVDHWCRVVNVNSKTLLQALEKIESVQIAYRVSTESERYTTEHNTTPQNTTEQNTTRQTDVQRNSEELASLEFPIQLQGCHEIWLARGVKPKQLETMLQAFPDPSFILGEAKKAVAWEEANPQRRKKDFARFLNNWLARAWDSRRVLPTKRNESEEREALNRAAAKEALRLMGVEE